MRVTRGLGVFEKKNQISFGGKFEFRSYYKCNNSNVFLSSEINQWSNSQLKNLRRHIDHLRTMDDCVVISHSGTMNGTDCSYDWFDLCKLKERMRKYFNVQKYYKHRKSTLIHLLQIQCFYTDTNITSSQNNSWISCSGSTTVNLFSFSLERSNKRFKMLL